MPESPTAALYLQSPSPSLLLLVVDAADSGDGGGQSPWQQFGGLSEVFWLGPQQGDDVLQGAGGLQAQSVHHVAQIVCGAETGRCTLTQPPFRWILSPGPLITVSLSFIVTVPMSVASCLVEWMLSWGMSRMASQ